MINLKRIVFFTLLTASIALATCPNEEKLQAQTFFTADERLIIGNLTIEQLQVMQIIQAMNTAQKMQLLPPQPMPLNFPPMWGGHY